MRAETRPTPEADCGQRKVSISKLVILQPRNGPSDLELSMFCSAK